MYDKQQIYALLNEQGIAYEAIEHPAVYTVQDVVAIDLPHPEAGAKNLFLRDDKKRHYYLLTLRHDLQIRLKDIETQLGTRKLSFASEKDLMNILGLISGAVTPFGVLNDSEHRVMLYIDDYFKTRRIAIHPNDNTATVYLDTVALTQLLRAHGALLEYIHIEPSA